MICTHRQFGGPNHRRMHSMVRQGPNDPEREDHIDEHEYIVLEAKNEACARRKRL